MPRKFPLHFRKAGTVNTHYALIGMATVVDGVPLYYDAANEHGLAMAGLNFPDNAHYYNPCDGKDNICQFELIPWILGRCKNLAEARALLEKTNIVNISFNESLPVTPLHWMVADKSGSVVIEAMSDGMHIHQNPIGVLTNNPPFEYHLFNLNNFRHLSAKNGKNTFSDTISLDQYSNGLGAIGMPGDVSSMSRFIRAAFNKENSACEGDQAACVSQFFHLLSSVEVCRGACITPSGGYNLTLYSSCINTDKGIYCYTTYSNRQITRIDMHKTDLNSHKISRYPLVLTEQFNNQN